MNPSIRLRENISAMADGELPACDTELTLAALADPDGQHAWLLYHLIGDTLRADTAGMELSPGFAVRLAHRLAAEEVPAPAGRPGPTVLIP